MSDAAIDIVERLRDVALWKPDGDDGMGFDECAEAADVIEALRSEVSALREALDQP